MGKQLSRITKVEGRPAMYAPSLEMYRPRHNNLAPHGVKEDQLVVDKETGFLTPRRKNSAGFTAQKKVELIELLKDCFPNVQKALQVVGVHTTVFKNHLILDKKFLDAYEQIKLSRIDHVEGKMFEFSEHPKGFMDRIAILRAYRGELYNPVQKVQHVPAPFTEVEASRRRVHLENVIDAEVVNVSAEVLDAEVSIPGVEKKESAEKVARREARKKDPVANLE